MAGFEDAACRAPGVDPEVFFPPNEDQRTPLSVRDVEAAKAVCRRCPVAAACLAAAFDLDEPGFAVGIFGGMTGPERDRVVRAGRAAEQAVINAAKAAAHRDRHRVRGAERPAGRCPTCRRREYLRRDGLVVRHPRRARGPVGQACGGSGQVPLPLDTADAS
jgi:hypothetical protein